MSLRVQGGHKVRLEVHSNSSRGESSALQSTKSMDLSKQD